MLTKSSFHNPPHPEVNDYRDEQGKPSFIVLAVGVLAEQGFNLFFRTRTELLEWLTPALLQASALPLDIEPIITTDKEPQNV